MREARERSGHADRRSRPLASLGDGFVGPVLVQQRATELGLPVDDAPAVRLEQAILVLTLVEAQRLALADELVEDLVDPVCPR